MIQKLKSKSKSISQLYLGNSNQNPRQVKHDIIIPGAIFVLFLITAYRKIQFQTPSLTDFLGAYYPAGKLILEHPEHLYKLGDIDIFGFVNLPIVAYLFVPFSWLSPTIAKTIFTLLGFLTVAIALGLMIKHFQIRGYSRILLLILLLINTPLYNSIWFGNTTHVILLLAVGAVFCLNTNRPVLSGSLLGLAGLIKIPLLIPALYFVAKRQWRSLLGFSVTVLGAVTLSVVVCGVQLNLDWLHRCILPLSNKAVAAYNVQSLDAFLIRLLTPSSLNNWESIDVDLHFKLLRYSLLTILIGATILTCVRVNQSEQSRHPGVTTLGFCSFLCLSLLISPISWSHYYLLLLLPYAAYVGGRLKISKNWKWSTAMFISAILVSLPPVSQVPSTHPILAFLVRSFLVSHYFWGGVLLLGILLMAQWKICLSSSD